MEENIASKMVCPKCKSPNIEYADGTYRCLDCGCEWQLSDDGQAKMQSLTIRNSTAEFLIFQIEGKEQGVEVYYKDKTVWCTQKAMGVLFDCTSDNISVHLQNIYDTDELKRESTTEKISVVRREGNRDVNRTLQFYNLDAIISVGYRVNSIRATQFRQWATGAHQ